MNWIVRITVISVFIGLTLLTGCDEEGGIGCVGNVTKTYTEYKDGGGVVVGGVVVPSGGSTRYYIAVEKSDGTFCSRRLDKNTWLGIKEGDTYEGA